MRNHNKKPTLRDIAKPTIGDIITFGGITLLWLALGIYSVIQKNYTFLLLCALATVVFCGIFIRRIVLYVRYRRFLKIEKTVQETQDLINEFNSRFDVDLGYVTFIHLNLKFSAKGKFACVKDFNGKPGYHLAFYVKGTELVSAPTNYDDVLNYKETLFTIELGYFEGYKLSQPENDNGIVVDDISDLKGKTIKIASENGYITLVETVEFDNIDCGEITFEQWDENAHIISFKLFVSCGLSDIVVGKLELTEDCD